MTARQTLLDRLHANGCRVDTSGRAATCPAHEDRNASLSIATADRFDGVLVKCHAGCAVDDVLAALEMTAGDLFDEPHAKRNGWTLVAEYAYTDAAGTVLYVKERRFPKDFRVKRPTENGWTYSIGDAPRVLYRLPDVLAAVRDGRPVYVVEGEKDADALAALGVAATTNYEGAAKGDQRPKWRPEYGDALRGADVVIVADKDEPGRAHVAAVAADLDGKARSVRLVEALSGKDTSDHLAAGHTVAELVPTTATPPAPTPTKPSSGRAPSASTALVQLALREHRLAMTPDDEPFAVPLAGPQIPRPLRGGRGSLRAALAAGYFADTGQAAPQQALTDALLVLEGLARGNDPEQLQLRVAGHNGAWWLDLGDDSGRAVRVADGRWSVENRAPVLFRRTATTGALPTPERGGTVDELWTLLNVAERDRPLILASLVTSLDPTVPQPVLTFRGEQGTGKSTASRIVAGLLDPSPAQTRKPPRDVDAWVTAAQGSWVVAVDNVSTIPDWLSDAMCRAVTGDGDVRRRLYTDSDLTVFAFRRRLILNGIDLGTVRDDLAERLLVVDLARIADTARRADGDLARAWTAAHPRILAAVLDLAATVHATLPTTRPARLPRMADFGRILAAVDTVLGTRAVDAYSRQGEDLAADAVDADPVLAAVARSIAEPWTGTAAELLAALRPNDDDWKPPRDWPKNARALTAVMRRRAPSLRRLGWRIEDLGRGGHDKALRFAIVPPSAGNDAGNAGNDAGNTATMRATSAPVARTVTTAGPAATPADSDFAGNAGNERGQSPLLRTFEERGEPDAATVQHEPVREGPSATSATPATPAPHPQHLGACARCQRPTHRYGDGGNPLCAECRRDTRRPTAVAS